MGQAEALLVQKKWNDRDSKFGIRVKKSAFDAQNSNPSWASLNETASAILVAFNCVSACIYFGIWWEGGGLKSPNVERWDDGMEGRARDNALTKCSFNFYHFVSVIRESITILNTAQSVVRCAYLGVFLFFFFGAMFFFLHKFVLWMWMCAFDIAISSMQVCLCACKSV